MCVIDWFNINTGAVSAIATVALAILTCALLRVGNIQAKAALASAEAAKESVKIYDALKDIERKRDSEKSVYYVQVPNMNIGGYEEFHTNQATALRHGTAVKNILITHDNTVKIELQSGIWMSYAGFIKWSQ
ncbi:hypothetical protein WDW37_06625 [Bdellovibrionota bacterium FG-1]